MKPTISWDLVFALHARAVRAKLDTARTVAEESVALITLSLLQGSDEEKE